MFYKAILIFLVSTQAAVQAFAPIPVSARIPVQLGKSIDPEAEDDGGPEPSRQEWAELKKIASNVHYPKQISTSVARHVVAPINRVAQLARRLIGNPQPNLIIFSVLKLLRELTQDYSPELREVNFSGKIQDTLFYQTKLNVGQSVELALAYPTLKLAPKIKEVNEEVTPSQYLEWYDDKVEPYESQMISKSPEDCFLQNSAAFCQPESPGSSRYVCDLDYLATYSVKKGTPFRYGGRAVVQGNEIVEISGVTKSDSSFETKKNIFLSSFAVHLVAGKHAVMAHLAIYQQLLIKMTTNRSKAYEDAWKDHLGPYRFLQGLLSRTNEVSVNEQLLIGPGNSLVSRATSLTNMSLLKLCTDVYNKYKKMKPRELVESNAKEGNEKWNRACVGAYEAGLKAVETICKDLISDNILTTRDVEDLALLVWASTFYHFFIGDFQLDNVNKGNLPFPLTGKPHDQKYSYAILSTTIGVTTMTRTCDMDTLASYLPEPYQRRAWEDYCQYLQNIKLGIKDYDNRNTPIYNSINF